MEQAMQKNKRWQQWQKACSMQHVKGFLRNMKSKRHFVSFQFKEIQTFISSACFNKIEANAKTFFGG
jgi:hypothetical protein